MTGALKRGAAALEKAPKVLTLRVMKEAIALPLRCLDDVCSVSSDVCCSRHGDRVCSQLSGRSRKLVELRCHHAIAAEAGACRRGIVRFPTRIHIVTSTTSRSQMRQIQHSHSPAGKDFIVLYLCLALAGPTSGNRNDDIRMVASRVTCVVPRTLPLQPRDPWRGLSNTFLR